MARIIHANRLRFVSTTYIRPFNDAVGRRSALTDLKLWLLDDCRKNDSGSRNTCCAKPMAIASLFSKYVWSIEYVLRVAVSQVRKDATCIDIVSQRFPE